MADGILTTCNVACGSGIVTVNSPSGSTLQCDTWLSVISNQQSRETVVGTSGSITVSSVTTLNSIF